MPCKKILFFLLCSLISFNIAWADCVEDDCCTFRGNNQLYIGPEAYYVRRVKNGGSKQNGWAGGLKLGYDRIKPFGWYWGFEAYYAFGRLNGHASSGDRIKSNYYDAQVEGRIGFTFAQQTGHQHSITPYAGGGYLWETNNFIHPSPLHIHTNIKGPYVCGGFLSQMTLCNQYDIGINFEAKYILDAKNFVSHDPDYSDSEAIIKNKMQYKIEIPLQYHYYSWNLGIVPYYEYRHYGGQAGFPFDFVETKSKIWGAFFKATYFL